MPGTGAEGVRRAQRQQVRIRAEAADLPARDVGNVRMVPERLAGVNVGQVHFHHGAAQDGQRVADGHAGVRPRAGVDEHGVHAFAVRLVDVLAHLAFVVGLKAGQPHAQLIS